MMNRRIAASIFVTLFVICCPLRAFAQPATQSAWPRGWLFCSTIVAKEPADHYDATLEHNGLANPEGRDVRVIGPDGMPVSIFLAFADTDRFRILIDAVQGPGEYRIYFGNLTSKILPPVPDGITPFGRKDWMPQGGYTCLSFDPIERIDTADMTSLPQVMDIYATIQKRADEEQKKEDAPPPAPAEGAPVAPPAKHRKFVLRTVHRSANTDISNVNAVELLRDENAPPARVGGNWFHIFRAQITVPQAGSYEFSLGDGRPNTSLGILFVDGNHEKPVINGWFTKSSGGIVVFDAIGKTDLTAGTHVIEVYTTRRNPEIRIGLAGANKPLEYLRGLDAQYDKGVAIEPGEFKVESGDVADSYLTSIGELAKSGRFSTARNLTRVAQKRFATDPERLKQFSAAFEMAEQGAYAGNWLTEGKFPSRSAVLSDAKDFAPPLRQAGGSQDNFIYDQRHISSTVWVEGKPMYGLANDVQETPWAVTSGICVADNMLFVGTKNGVMHAVNLSQGAAVWTFPGGGPVLGSPLLYRETLYFGSLDRRLYAIDARRGRMIWNFPSKGWIDGSPCASGDRIFFGSRDKNLYALDAALGIERWHAALDDEVIATPCTDGQRVYIGTRGGTFYAVDVNSGQIAWKYSAGAAIQGAACVGDNRVAFGDLAGNVHFLDAATGQLAWLKPVAVNGPVIAGVIRVGNVIYGGTDNGQLFGIDVDDAQLGWQIDMPWNGSVARQPLFVDGNLVFTSRQRDVRGADGAIQQLRGGTAIFQPTAAPPQPIPTPQTTEAVTVDGNLNENLWTQIPRLPAFFKQNGMSFGDPVEAKLSWDATQLLLSVHVKKADLIASAAAADGELRDGDAITIAIDPKGEGAATMRFTVSPTGVKTDELATPDTSIPENAKAKETLDRLKLETTGLPWNPAWSALVSLQGTPRTPVDAKATPTPPDADEGWTAEVAIPFESLPKQLAPAPQNNQTWKINVIVTRAKADGTTSTWALSPTITTTSLGQSLRWPNFQFTVPPAPPK